MECDVYETKSSIKFVFVPKDSELDIIPQDIRNQIIKDKPWKTVNVQTNTRRMALDSKMALKDIDETNYHLAIINILFDEY